MHPRSGRVGSEGTLQPVSLIHPQERALLPRPKKCDFSLQRKLRESQGRLLSLRQQRQLEIEQLRGKQF